MDSAREVSEPNTSEDMLGDGPDVRAVNQKEGDLHGGNQFSRHTTFKSLVTLMLKVHVLSSNV